MNANCDIENAEIIGIIKTIAFLQNQKAFKESTMVHVHHVDNTNALLWAANLSHSIKTGGTAIDYAELVT